MNKIYEMLTPRYMIQIVDAMIDLKQKAMYECAMRMMIQKHELL